MSKALDDQYQSVYRLYDQLDLRRWERRGIINGYTVICQPDACSYCKHYEGFHYFGEGLPLPPFNKPNGCYSKPCGCARLYHWKYGNKYYNPQTGKIQHPECNQDYIVRELNKFFVERGLEENLDWNRVKKFGWYDGKKIKDFGKNGNGKVKVGDIIGYETVLCGDSVVDVNGTSNKNQLDYWINDAIDFGKKFSENYSNDWWFLEKIPVIKDIASYYTKSISTVINSGYHMKYDLKLKENTVFGGRTEENIRDNKNTGRLLYGYLWKGKLLYYDAPGNIVIGALCGAIGFSWFYTVFGANLYAGAESLMNSAVGIITLQGFQSMKPDDKEDIDNFKIGWDIAQSRLNN